MKKLMGAILVVTLMMLTSTPSSAAAPATTSTTTLKIGSTIPLNSPPTRAAEWWASEVEKRTNGAIKFTYFWGGSLISKGGEIDAVRTGLVDVACINTTSFTDKLPILNMQLPALFSPADQFVMLEVFKTMLRQPAFVNDMERYNTKLLFVTTVGSRDLQSKVPMKTTEEFKGKKFGVVGVYYPKALAAVGAVGVAMPLPDRYLSLKTGVIDAHLLAIESSYTAKIDEVCRYCTMMGFGAELIGTDAINRDTWNKLSPGVQRIMQEAALDAAAWNAKFVTDQREEARQAWEKAGVTFYNFPTAEKVKWVNALENYPLLWAKEMDVKGFAGTQLMKAYLDACKKQGHQFPRDWPMQ
jgi:TRAP-type C4-dicarboxylate transport system substrate-binding protein